MNGKTVLIVEDEPAIREMVGFALSRAGFEVDEAVDGAEAQERLAEDARISSCRIPALASPRATSRASRSGSTGWSPAGPGTAAVPAWDWP